MNRRQVSTPVRVKSRTWALPYGHPFGAYLAMRERLGDRSVFLLESLSGPEAVARRATVGFGPLVGIRVRDRHVTWHGREDLVRWLRDATAGLRLWEDRSTADVVDVLAQPSGVWSLLRAIRDQFQVERDTGAPHFRFGFFGYLGYDMAWAVERLPRATEPDSDLPDLDLTIYQGCVEYDLAQRTTTLVVNESGRWHTPDIDALRRLLTDAAETPETGHTTDVPEATEPSCVTDSVDQDEYLLWAKTALEHIAAGDIYQVQLGHDIRVRTELEPIAAYRRLRSRNPSPYGYLAPFGEWTALGASPELFVRREGDIVTMKPIAGTISRSPALDEDLAARRQLREDEKEQAEHVMLVDLCRNDIGRICRSGTLDAADLLEVEPYSHVHHLVSTVSGQLDPEHDEFDIITACFPAGTMTGAPKIRAMEIIERLEKTRRGIYAGALGLIDFSGDLNIALCIRGAVHRAGTYVMRASAGVVADSDPAREWAETLHKLGAMHWTLTGREVNDASTAH
ncbi:anthranilate synthase component I family protein [Streptomyces sp. MspMP-M5]|uniref:anthranilate synthase component I family protein n=1 Tax=unclassified Streptomyces TaxID=2593676 RepID=UPI0004771301|nr:anthranilate synthase component I family protein [Streptomyces sp. MspMP-M5]